MSATMEQAVDEMYALVNGAWVAAGYPYEHVDWPGVANYVPPTDAPWMRVKAIHADGGQASLAGGLGKRQKWSRVGTLWVNIFTINGSGLSLGYQLAKIVVDSLEGKSTDRCVWFRRVRTNEIGTSGIYQQINVLADFSYEEIK